MGFISLRAIEEIEKKNFFLVLDFYENEIKKLKKKKTKKQIKNKNRQPDQKHIFVYLTFSHQILRPGKMIIFKVQGVRCIPKPYHLHLPA